MRYLKNLSDLVNPNIGTMGHLLTATKPIVALPHGMVQAYPDIGEEDGQRYIKDYFEGMRIENLIIMPTVSEIDVDTIDTFDHEMENVHPYEYSVFLEKSGILFKNTVSFRSLISCIIYPKTNERSVCIKTLEHLDVKEDQNANALELKISEKNQFYYVQFSEKFNRYEKTEFYKDGKCWTCIKVYWGNGKQIDVRIGLSYIGKESAEREVKELYTKTYFEIRNETKKIWNQKLARIQIKGGSEEQKIIFYTALYRSLLQMRNVTENGKYRGYDGKIHESREHDYYVSDNLWDSFRCKHPLQLLIEPSVQEDIIESYARMYEQSGWLPQFPEYNGDRNVMLGNHAAAMVLDTVTKGYENFSLDKVYEGLKKNSLLKTKLPWTKGMRTELDDFYFEKGYFPALELGEKEENDKVHKFEKRQAVAVTLEHSYDDWCIYKLAEHLSLESDVKKFYQQSSFYKNLFNEETGFMSPKNKEGTWVREFDSKLSGGLGGRDYFAECNAWIFTFFVPHDINGLAKLMGGMDALENKLDRLFQEKCSVPKYKFLGQFPDSTGLIGQYCHGNEPAFHIPFLYNFTNSPWKTQRIVRKILNVWYSNTPFGLCGDDDEGALSSWYVWAAMGLYPVCVGKSEYAVCTPLFEKIEIQLENGKKFTIKTNSRAYSHKYIQKIYLNGENYDSMFLSDAAIRAGGSITLDIGKNPITKKKSRR